HSRLPEQLVRLDDGIRQCLADQPDGSLCDHLGSAIDLPNKLDLVQHAHIPRYVIKYCGRNTTGTTAKPREKLSVNRIKLTGSSINNRIDRRSRGGRPRQG